MSTIVEQRPCHTPACGWEKGMDTNGPADLVRIGRILLLVCQRCGGHWAERLDSLKEKP